MKLAYDVYSPGITKVDLNPVILHHGMVESRKTWKPLGQSLAEQTGRKVYAVDARSHGESPRTMEYNYDVMADDLEEFMKDHGIENVILVGHSMGGKVVITFSLRKPEKVEMVIVEDVPVRNFQQRLHNVVTYGVNMFSEICRNLDEMKTKEEAEHFVKEIGILASDLLQLPHDFIRSYSFDNLPFMWNGEKYELQINMEALENAILSDTLEREVKGRYDGDALFLIGSMSHFKTGKDPLIEKFFPKVTKVWFKDAGHFIHAQFPNEFLKEVVEFINGRSRLASKY